MYKTLLLNLQNKLFPIHKLRMGQGFGDPNTAPLCVKTTLLFKLSNLTFVLNFINFLLEDDFPIFKN
jgi:hypothetical protein